MNQGEHQSQETWYHAPWRKKIKRIKTKRERGDNCAKSGADNCIETVRPFPFRHQECDDRNDNQED